MQSIFWLIWLLIGVPLSAAQAESPPAPVAEQPAPNAETHEAQDEPADPAAAEYQAWAKQLWLSLQRQQGEITLPNDIAELKVSNDFYYLNAADAEKVLVEVWGNPPDQNTLGMLLPANTTPFDADSWGVIIEYEEEGYVSDADADQINYDELLVQMQAEISAANEARTAGGYEALKLIGWASKPYYDKAAHKLHWAKEIQFGDNPEHTLNYNIRVLGRKGVLVLNFVAGIAQQQAIEANLSKVLALANFKSGNRYEDFDPSLDKVAAYGLSALVAGTVLSKTGILAIILIFLKKFGLLIVVVVGGLAVKLFRRNKSALAQKPQD